jgi:hypothetical protein
MVNLEDYRTIWLVEDPNGTKRNKGVLSYQFQKSPINSRGKHT